MISVRQQHGQRSQRAISMDARQTASRVYDPDSDNLFPWQRHPNRCDVEGVDTRMVAKKPTVAKTAPVEKPEPKREYRYAMYNRPVWGGLSLSQPYTIDFDLNDPGIAENRKYYNRDAHSILVTTHPLTADEIRKLEMVDIAADNKQRSDKAAMIEYTNNLDELSDNGKRAIIHQIESGKYVKNKSDVDKYADKFMSQGKRKEEEKAKVKAKTETPSQKVTQPPSTGFQADPTLIDRDLAMRSHAGTSWSPKERGEMEIKSFVEDVEHVRKTLMQSTESPEELAMVDREMDKFQKGYAQKWNARMAAHSSCFSSMIAGPSKFPARKAEKANKAYDKRTSETIEYKERAINAITKKLKDHRISAGGGEVAMMEKKLASAEAEQVRMKAVNKILRSKKTSDDVKMLQLRDEFGMPEQLVHNLMNPDWGKPGYPAYKLTNNNANIKRMKERVKEMQAREDTPTAEIKFAGGTIIDSNEDDRVQIFYDERPSPDMIKQLKGSGWRWAPSLGVWQRKRTPAAMTSAKQITGV